MTFEGRNFDICAGLTAPVIFYFGYKKSSLSNKALLIWNLLSLSLLINILSIAVQSAKSTFQQFAFNERNIALGYFPLTGCPVWWYRWFYFRIWQQLGSFYPKQNKLPAFQINVRADDSQAI